LTVDFLAVTELASQRVSKEQLDRICHRYHWAASQCHDADVLEVACGAGQGLALLQAVSRSLSAGDFSPEIVERARVAAPDLELRVFPAERAPFADGMFDRIILFEALYYVETPAFLSEVKRLLRPGGTLLLATANKDLYDFTPSPHATRYLGAQELGRELAQAGFEVELFGYLDTARVSLRQRLLRPAKAIASRLGIIPDSLAGRERLKRLFFGEMCEMPQTLHGLPFDYTPPEPIAGDRPDLRHKVIYCRAVLTKGVW